MSLREFQRDVMRDAVAFGGDGENPLIGHEKKAEQVLAAAVLVANERGPEWCAGNPEAYQTAVINSLGIWLKVAVFIAGLFTGGSLWLTLAGYLLPAVISWFTAQAAAGAYGSASDELASLAREAEEFLGGDEDREVGEGQ